MNKQAVSVAGVMGSIAPIQGEDRGSTPTAALHDLIVQPVPVVVAKILLEHEHYLHSLPGGTLLAFGVLLGRRLMGVITIGVGPVLAYHLVEGAEPNNCAALTRLWLSDELPRNSESRVLGIVLRSLRRYTNLKFVVTYADPEVGHIGTIYQATGWLYTGFSEAMPLVDLGDGKARHSRSVGQVFGTHSVQYLTRQGLSVRRIPQAAKHRYIYFLDPEWRSRLQVPVLRYPRREVQDEDC